MIERGQDIDLSSDLLEVLFVSNVIPKSQNFTRDLTMSSSVDTKVHSGEGATAESMRGNREASDVLKKFRSALEARC